MTLHRSTAYVHSIGWRGRNPITSQFRFIVRMAYACHERGVPYDLTWKRTDDGHMAATVTASGNIPSPKALPKPPKPKRVADWKPSIFDAEYRLDAWQEKDKKRPGFVIAHSWGLSLVHPSESGELGLGPYGDDEDIRQNWLVTHTASGLGFGLTLSFKRATDALLLAATFTVDWSQSVDALRANPEFRRAGYTVQAAYGSAYEKDSAKRKLADLERAA